MKNIIIGLVIGLLLNGLIVSAKEQIVINPLKNIYQNRSRVIRINTTKVQTPEGIYRIFLYDGYNQGGITAVKIK